MKQCFTVLMAIGIPALAFGQMKPEPGDFGIGFRVTGLANIGLFNFGQTNIANQEILDPLDVIPATQVRDLLSQNLIFARYYLNEVAVLRLGLGAAWLDRKLTTSVNINGVLNSNVSSLSSYSVGVLGGLERHLTSAARRIDPYVGGQVGLSYLGGIHVMMLHTTETSGVARTTEIITDYPAGWAANADVLMGLNYFVCNNFAVGAELSIGFLMVHMGGPYSQTTTERENANGTITSSESVITGMTTFRQMGIRTGSTAGITATFFW